MTSKEALNNIEKLFIGSSINLAQQFEIIEKDLEILSILKTKIFNEHCFDLDVGWYDDNFHLNERETKIIKEWIENDK